MSGGSATDLGISIMLLGSISFMMATFYLVNHRDRRMQQYSWRVISSTISIFSAVLLFQGVNGVVEYCANVEDRTLLEQFFVDIMQMFCWFGILQLMLGYFSGAFGERWHKPRNLSEMQMNMKTFAVLLGHITGFSAINAWGALQQLMYYDIQAGGDKESGVVGVHGSTLRAALVIPIAYVAMSVVYTLTEGVRMKVAKFNNDIDEYEMYWMDQTEDTENDVTGLTISFLVVQVLRLVIGGYLPNQEGDEQEGVMHTNTQAFILVAVSVFFAIVKGKIKPIEGFHRTHNVTMLVLAMSVAWCFFFSTSWIVTRGNRFQEHEAIEGVVLALVCTCVSFTIILSALEAIELRYQDRPPETIERAVHAVIESLGILVGFSWEHSFDAAIKIIAEEVTVMPQPVTKLCLAIALFSLVGPAWRLYILPGVLVLDEEELLEQEEVALKGLYGKLMAGTIEVTHHMVQAPLELLMSNAEEAKTEELQERAREKMEVMERKMKVETLSKQHARLSEQSIMLATRLANLGHTDVLVKARDDKMTVERNKELELALIRMNEVDREREIENAKLKKQIQEMEEHTRSEAERISSMGAGKFGEMEAKVADSEMRAQKAEGEVADALGNLANVNKEVVALRVEAAGKDEEIDRLQTRVRQLSGLESEEQREEAQVAALQEEVAAKMEEVEVLRRQEVEVIRHQLYQPDAGEASPSVTLTSRNASGASLPQTVPQSHGSRPSRVVGGLQHLVQEGEAQAAALLHSLGVGHGHGHGQLTVPGVQVPKSPSPTSPISPASLTRTRMSSAPGPVVFSAAQQPPQEPLQVRMPGPDALQTSRSPRVFTSTALSTTTSPTQVVTGQPPPISPSAGRARPSGGVLQQSPYLRGSQAPWVQQVANNSLQTPLLR